MKKYFDDEQFRDKVKKYANADINCDGYYFCDTCEYCGTTSSSENKDILCGYTFKTKINNYVMNFENITFDEDKNIKGNIVINVHSKSFNHASCNSFYSNKMNNIFDIDQVVIKYEINFEMTEKDIILEIIQEIVV